jgi:hypothetical protein
MSNAQRICCLKSVVFVVLPKLKEIFIGFIISDPWLIFIIETGIKTRKGYKENI